jgi:predicted amidohydrolase YtcJ
VTDATVFDDGRVFTGLRYVESVLIESGRVVAVGTTEEVRRLTPTGAERRPLDGRLVLPGLIDAHVHLAELTRRREGLDLGRVGSIEELVAAVRAWAAAHPQGPIVGSGWDPERSSSRAWPTRADLDRAESERPVFISHASGHAGVANSAALAHIGVGRDTADPPGGRLGRGADGRPNGQLFESALAEFVGRPGDLPLPDAASLGRTIDWCASLGLTTLGAMSVTPEEAALYREMESRGALPVRVRGYLHARRWRDAVLSSPRSSARSGQYATIGVKAFADGAFGTRTAWLDAPYSDDPGNSGMSVTGVEELAGLAAAAGERGLAPAIHAIGDRAVATALDALGRPRGETRAPARIEHASLTPPSVWIEMDRVRPVLVVQPGFIWSDHWLSSRLGPERARWAYVFRTLGGHGLIVAGSSDAPYDPADPWRGIRAAVHRTDPSGRSANPRGDEALSPERAVQLYTANGGVALGEPGLGTLEAGAPADLLVMGVPSLEEAVAAGSATVRETWSGGRRIGTGADGKTV